MKKFLTRSTLAATIAAAATFGLATAFASDLIDPPAKKVSADAEETCNGECCSDKDGECCGGEGGECCQEKSEHEHSHSDTEVEKEIRVTVSRSDGDVDAAFDEVFKKIKALDLPDATKKQILASIKKSMNQGKSNKPKVLQYQIDTQNTDGETKVTSNVQVLNLDKLNLDKLDDLGTELKMMFIDEDGKTKMLENVEKLQLKFNKSSDGKLNELLERSKGLQKKLQMHVSGMEGIQAILTERGMDSEAIAAIEEAVANASSKSNKRFVVGISLDEQTEGVVEVEEVFDDSPAAKAGLKRGDVIVSVNGNDLQQSGKLIEVVQEAGVDSKQVKFTVNRDGEVITVDVQPSVAEEALTGMPENLTARLKMLESGGGQAFLFDGDSKKDLSEMTFRVQGKSEGMQELRDDVESLKSDMKDIKSMLKKLLDK